MSVAGDSSGRRWSPLLIGSAVVALVVFVAWLVAGSGRGRPTPAVGEQASTAQRQPETPPAGRARVAPLAAPAGVPAAAAPAEELEAEAAAAEAASETNQDEIASAWASVDMDSVRKAMPDNLYFKMSSPTADTAIRQQREEERARWNVEYGKVLSGTGTEEEIRAFYDQRARLSTDYVEFATYILDHYGDALPERDVELLELARRMNLTRLEEIPRKVEEALQRKAQQDQARQAWLADQAEFGAGENADPNGSER